MAAISMVLARKMAIAVYSLFGVVMGIAVIYLALSLSIAVIAQLILYGGAVMVLVMFALFLYGESQQEKSWSTTKSNIPKSIILLILITLITVQFPWKATFQWLESQDTGLEKNKATLAEIGQTMATSFVTEFEMLGILMLAALIVAGWFIAAPPSQSKP